MVGEGKGEEGCPLQLGTLDPAVEEGGKGGHGGELGLGRPGTSFFPV